MGKQTQRGDMTKVPRQISLRSWDSAQVCVHQAPANSLMAAWFNFKTLHWWKQCLWCQRKPRKANRRWPQEPYAQCPGQGPALARYGFNLRHKKIVPLQSGNLAFQFIWILRNQNLDVPDTWNLRISKGLAHSQRYPVRDRKTYTSPSCFQSISSSGSFTHSGPVPPPLGISLLQEPHPSEGPACRRKGRQVCTHTLRSPSWHCSHQENNRGEMKIIAQRYIMVLPKRELSAEESRRGGNT